MVFFLFSSQDDNEEFHKNVDGEDDDEVEGVADASFRYKQQQQQQINPKIHTFRVISACDAISCCDNNNKKKNDDQDENEQLTRTTRPTTRTNILYCCIQKPILMCFICKLSFGNTKTFILHSNQEHQLNLPELERNLLKLETYSSAIIQRSMDEKPQLSFLQPLNLQLTNHELTQAIEQQQQQSQQQKQQQQENKIKKTSEEEQAAEGVVEEEEKCAVNLTTTPTTTPLIASIKKELQETKEQLNENLAEGEEACGNDAPCDSQINEERHDSPLPPPPLPPLAPPHHHQISSSSNTVGLATSPSTTTTFSTHFVDFLHENFNAKTSALPPSTTPTISQQQQQQQNYVQNLINQQQQQQSEDIQKNLKFVNDFFETKFLIKQQQQQECDTSLSDDYDTTTTRTTPTTTSPFNHLGQQQQNAAAAAAAAAAASLTIGACPEHANGRPVGVDCMRCEMLLNSARLNSGMQMSTRNSCKTLKCPQCNWHYKYQETLEIHMREKHPDGESACGYCLAGE